MKDLKKNFCVKFCLGVVFIFIPPGTPIYSHGDHRLCLVERELTCYKFTAVQVVRVADVVVAEAPDAVVVEGLEAATDAAVVLETAVGGLLHLPTTAAGNLAHFQLPASPGGEVQHGEVITSSTLTLKSARTLQGVPKKGGNKETRPQI